jgi:ABC-type multidrug transport system fused ATPase/permease subunit
MKILSAMQWRLLGYLRKYLFPYVLLLGMAMLVLSAATAAVPLLIRLVGDLGTNLGSAHLLDAHGALKLREYSLVLAGLFLLRAVANFSEDYLSSYIAQKITLDLRADLNESLQRQSLSFFNRTPTGVMVSRVINDVNVVTQGITGGAFSVFGDGTQLISLLATAFYLDWRLAIVAFIGFPIVVVPIIGLSKKVRRETKNAQKQMSGLQSLLHEGVRDGRLRADAIQPRAEAAVSNRHACGPNKSVYGTGDRGDGRFCGGRGRLVGNRLAAIGRAHARSIRRFLRDHDSRLPAVQEPRQDQQRDPAGTRRGRARLRDDGSAERRARQSGRTRARARHA